MKTKYFKRVKLTDKGKSNFAEIVKLSPEALTELNRWFKELKSIPANYMAEAEDIALKTNSSKELVSIAISLGMNLLPRIWEYKDTPEDLVEDAREANLITTDRESEVLLNYLKSIVSYSKNLYILDKKDDEVKGLSYLERMRMGVAIRPIFEKDFQYGKDSVPDYEPNAIDYTAVATVELETSADMPVFFQLDINLLDRLISELLALQAQLRLMHEVIDKKIK